MSPELKQKWIDALLSGKYSQGHLRLAPIYYPGTEREQQCYCCLGVLLDVVDPSRWQKAVTMLQYNFDDFGDWTDSELGSVGRALTGLTEIQEGELICLNDTQRASFEEIAKWIAKWIKENV